MTSRGILHGVTWTGGPRDGRLSIIDQTRLPAEVVDVELVDLAAVRGAILRLAVRGAPAIGIAAAYGVVVHLRNVRDNLGPLAAAADLAAPLAEAVRDLGATRPTAINLRWALGRMERSAAQASLADVDGMIDRLYAEATLIHAEDKLLCDRIAAHGRDLLPLGGTIYTHCNTGSLATGGVGTALGCIIAAHQAGRGISVIAGETRPLLQGSRLTAPELMHARVPVRLACDSTAGSLMARGLVQGVMVGADRIARNGDTANKIGTYALAVLARFHHIPFLVAAPASTFDHALATGAGIPIEERGADEVIRPLGVAFAPPATPVVNPAFDVTPADLITAIVTEAGVLRPPFAPAIAAFLEQQERR